MASRVVITGGAGFVGSMLARRLGAEGRDVLLIDNLRYGHIDNLVDGSRQIAPFIARDVRDPLFSELLRPDDIVVHLAGISALPECQSNPVEAYSVNVLGVVNVLAAARTVGVRRFVFASTSAVYENGPAAPHSEAEDIRPDLVYSTSKAIAESVCRGFAVNHGMDVVILRFFNVYGAHQDFARPNPPFTSYVAREAVSGRRCTIYNNNPAVERDYVHVDDLCALLRLVIDDPGVFAGDVFNVGSGAAYSVPHILSVFGRILGRPLEADYADPTDIWFRYPDLFTGPHPLSRDRVRREVMKSAKCDPSKTAARFDWRPRIGLEDGLRDVVEYVRSRVSPV